MHDHKYIPPHEVGMEIARDYCTKSVRKRCHLVADYTSHNLATFPQVAATHEWRITQNVGSIHQAVHLYTRPRSP